VSIAPALVALALTLAAAPSAPVRCSSSGRAWHELRTAHFVLATDLPPDDADEVAEQLEVLLGAVVRGPFDPPPTLPDAPLRVVAFARVEDLRAFVPKPIEGFHAVSSRRESVIVARADVGRVTRAGILAHELTHAVLRLVLPRPPRWLDEGLATYMEAAGEGEDGETIRIGTPPPNRLAVARGDRVPVAEVLTPRRRFEGGEYATSWLLVHYLLAQHRTRFLAYEQRLTRREDPVVAWREVFPEWDPANAASVAKLDDALLRYVRDDGKYVELSFPARGEGAYRSSEMTAAEVDALCAALPKYSGDYSPRR
jgi:hypothetical protein